jgi:hypothetical protein
MTDHFSVIGFKAGSAQELAGLLSMLPEKGGEPKPCRAGYYYRWHSEAGSELWIHMQKDDAPPASGERADTRLAVVGVTPFFKGEGRVKVRVMRFRQRPSDNAFEGAAFVEIEPGSQPHQCTTVALFDLVDFACASDRAAPFITTAQITAFPHQLAVFEDEGAFQASQAREDVKFAPKSFFASGLFTPVESDGGPTFHDPEASEFSAPSKAYFTGIVEKSELRHNPVTNQNFRWALVNTLGGSMDLVADETKIGTTIRPGMIIQGEFWLCGRLLTSDERPV